MIVTAASAKSLSDISGDTQDLEFWGFEKHGQEHNPSRFVRVQAQIIKGKQLQAGEQWNWVLAVLFEQRQALVGRLPINSWRFKTLSRK